MKQNLFNFSNGKRVFVSGCSGFKGAWLYLLLKALGAEFQGYSLEPNMQPNLFQLARIHGGKINLWADIRDANSLETSLNVFQPEIIFHLAAQPLVRRSYAEPVETFTTNVNGTLHLLEAARACSSTRAVVVVTTDKVYRNSELGHAFVKTKRSGATIPTVPAKRLRKWSLPRIVIPFMPTPGRRSPRPVREM